MELYKVVKSSPVIIRSASKYLGQDTADTTVIGVTINIVVQIINTTALKFYAY